MYWIACVLLLPSPTSTFFKKGFMHINRCGIIVLISLFQNVILSIQLSDA